MNFRSSTLVLLAFMLSLPAFSQVPLGLGRRPATGEGDKIQLSYANPREYEIADITVSGLETLDKNALISLSGLKVGDKIKIPGESTRAAIKKLWKSGIIGNVSINLVKVEGDKAWLSIDLTERPRLTRIVLNGVSKSQRTEIEEDMDLIKGRVVSDAVVKNAELTVRNFFVDKGYLNAEVDVKQEHDTLLTNGVTLIIDVEKNAKVKIDQINIYGNEAFGDNKLKSRLKKTNEKLRLTIFEDALDALTHTSPKEWLTFFTKRDSTSWEEVKEYLGDHANVNFFKTSKFLRDEYKADKEKLIAFYNSKGYRDATIVADSVYNVSHNDINIDLHIDEGQKYYFRDIIWSGNFVYNDEVLDRVMGVEKGDVYNMELIQKKLTFNPNGDDISALYMDNGYLLFRIDPVEVKVQDDSIDVEMRVYEGDQFKINEIRITGNDRTNDHVIRREIRTIPGDYFSRNLLIRTQRELSQLGYFDPEQIGINPLPNPADGTVDIEYALVERPSDQVELSGGWGGFYGFVGTVGLVFNNFSLRNIANLKSWRPLPVGDGQRLQLRVQANGRQFQNYSFTFTEPWLGGKKPNALTVGLNHSVVRTFPFGNFASRTELGSMTMTTASLGLAKRLKWPDDYFTLSNTLSITLYNFDNFVSQGNQAIGFNTGKARNFLYNFTLSRNSIDNPMFPRSGSQLTFSLSLTPPYSLFRDPGYYDNASSEDLYGWVEYNKWMIDATFYQKLIGNLTLSSRAHFGFINTYSDYAPTGPFDRFQLGGSGLSGNQWIVGYDVVSLRGYEDGHVTPPNWGGNAQNSGLQGGVSYNKFVFELRYPLTMSQASTIFVLAFAEGGNNYHDLADFDPFSLYKSVGVGARIFMPAFGLLGIDWGYGFDRLPGAPDISGGQFHFSIGQQFR